ncbi:MULTISPECIES: hypothetical protein [unclassified Imperialibacter]|uniref:hypothetical protein n=1 Tax=unclassified Imperialibacter TaxID=2629706 RepID=UPI0012515869|nr:MULTISPECIES: hypothetical protein [unclassified Imperialibacter]CAD5277237.1 conserved hypothetical protein [Imperialibacter sp. 75]CAD5295211.1 conserved hypothetical protein [Imperialibacter sp. 89]VVT12189.1 conserved hypothetical protein [Imperialibacter sp. EC-SDR9]
MSSFRIRPRFKHRVEAVQKDELESAICAALEQNKQFTFTNFPDHLYIKINPDERHIWSPQLHLSFDQEGNDVTVRGLYGPNPTIWAFFFFGYVAIGILMLFLGMWGGSLWSLGKDASVLWGIPVLAALAVGLYLFSQAGQKLGAQQMFDIHHFYEGITHNKVVVS